MQEQAVPQKDGSSKQLEVVIAYASKALNQAEQHYGSYKKELLGVVYALQHFRYYLLGKRFKVCTDHRGLEWLMKIRAQGNAAMIYRWQDVLSEYNFEIQYVTAAKMKHVDGISRCVFQQQDEGKSGICQIFRLHNIQLMILTGFH